MHRQGSLRLMLALAACAQLVAAPALAQAEPHDPFEKTNRGLFAFNQGLDRAILRPLALAYGTLPKPLRKGLRNITRNLTEPVVFANDMLQARPKKAARTVGRFTLNSTFGVAGLVDVAKHSGLPRRDNDFGLTLGRWGAGPGPYLFLPLLGPSSVRDGLGGAVDIALDPLTWARYRNKLAFQTTRTVTSGLNRRYEADRDIQAVYETSTDPYATIRSFYLQQRESLIRGSGDVGALPDFDAPAEPAAAPDAAQPLAPPPSPAAQPAPAAPPTPPSP